MTTALPVATFVLFGLALTVAERIAPKRALTDRAGSVLLDTVGLAWSTAVTLAGIAATEAALGPAPGASPGAPFATWLVFVLLSDLSRYLAHRALHHRWLWPGHRFHHSVTGLDWYAGNRAAPVHALLFIVPTVALAWALGVGPIGVTANAVLLVVWNGVMHTNLGRPRVERALEWVVTTPRYHHIHHSVDPTLGSRNLASVFTVWDRLGGTRMDPDEVDAASLAFGLEPAERVPAWRLLLGL